MTLQYWTFIILPVHPETILDIERTTIWSLQIEGRQLKGGSPNHQSKWSTTNIMTVTSSWLLKDHSQLNRFMTEDQCHHGQWRWWWRWWLTTTSSRPSWWCTGCCSSRHTKRCCLATGIIGSLVLLVGLILMVAGRSSSPSSSSLLSPFSSLSSQG